MTFNDVLLELLAHLRANNKDITIDGDAILQYPENLLNTLLQLGLLSPIAAAQSIECCACEKCCFMDVITLPHANPALSRAFIVCDDEVMHNQIGRVAIPVERLKQWQCSVKQLAQVIADLLGFKDKISFSANQSIIKLGMLKSLKGRRWVTLNTLTLSIEINKHAIAADDVLYFEGEQLLIDVDCINDLLNREPLSQGKAYIPSTNKRETKKLETQAMYQDWKDAYMVLSQSHSDKSKKWCSLQIAKMNIANGKDAETIRKNMI